MTVSMVKTAASPMFAISGFRMKLNRILPLLLSALSALSLSVSIPAGAQTLSDPLASPPKTNSLSAPAAATKSPEVQFLFDLEAKYQQAVQAGGGPAYASYFADDGVAIQNKTEVKRGRTNIAATAKWTPAELELTWTPQGGQMGSSGDMGFTWGHYMGKSRDKAGRLVVETGRYFTVWKRQADGSWKVAMDASNEEPADCTCSVDDVNPKQ